MRTPLPHWERRRGQGGQTPAGSGGEQTPAEAEGDRPCGIATASLGIGPGDLMNDLSAFGLVFETLVARDLRVYAEALDGTVRHYRDKSGLECDMVVGLRDGRSGLIEVKLGGTALIEGGAKSLNALYAKLDTPKTRTPSFRMVLVADGDFAYRRKDGVIVCPIGCLRP